MSDPATVRTFSLCLDDLEAIPPEKITIAGNKKRYVALVSRDYFDGETRDHDFWIAVQQSPEEKERGDKRIFIGGGQIHKNL